MGMHTRQAISTPAPWGADRTQTHNHQPQHTQHSAHLDVVSTDVIALVEVTQVHDTLATAPDVALPLQLSPLVLGDGVSPLQDDVHILSPHPL